MTRLHTPLFFFIVMILFGYIDSLVASVRFASSLLLGLITVEFATKNFYCNREHSFRISLSSDSWYCGKLIIIERKLSIIAAKPK